MVNHDKPEWLEVESRKIDTWEGLLARAMHTGLCGITLAMGQTPQLNPAKAAQQAVVDKELGRKLMICVSQGPLVREVDREFLVNPNNTVLENLEILETTFLGADEASTKHSELEKFRVLEKFRQAGGHKVENAIPAFCRHFSEMADKACTIVGRPAETELKLSELFTTVLHDDKGVKEIFSHDPPLVTLAAVQARATDLQPKSENVPCMAR